MPPFSLILVMRSAPVFILLLALPSTAYADSPERRIKELEIRLPEATEPVGIYRSAVVVGDLVYVAGHIPVGENGKIVRGRVGDDLTIAQGQAAARRAGIGILATLQHELGSLDRVERLVKTTGMVQCTSDFTEHPAVINGCSQLFVDVFGDQKGVGARCAVGMNSLPKGAVVEIEAVFQISSPTPGNP